MFIYKLGYNSFEESPMDILTHETQFSQEEFEGIVLKAIERIVEQKIKADDYVSNFETIYWDVIALLISEYKFKPQSYNAEFVPFGWGSIFKEDWDEDCPTLKKIIRYLNTKGYSEKNDSFINFHKRHNENSDKDIRI